MDSIRKWSRKVSMPIAFIICGLSCLFAAILLTRVTVWFSQKNMNAIEAEYVVHLDAYAAMRDGDTHLWAVIDDADDKEKNTPLDAAVVVIGEDTDLDVQAEEHTIDADNNGNVLKIRPVDDEQAPAYVVSVEDGQLFREVIQLPEEAKKEYDFYVGLDNIAAVLWYSVCLCLAALLFYIWKIKKPFDVLSQAVRKISANDLNFRVEYDGEDEFGRLCRAFEIMRQELEQNNRKMWNSVEERKRLNAAFAHDLRTPLTVMRGHTDMLLSTITEDTDPSGEMASSINAISNQITRLGTFADTMGSLQRLEDYEPCLKHMSSSALTEMVSQAAVVLFPGGQAEIHSELEEQEFLLDKEALAQICENILSNAVRYVRETLMISLCQEQKYVLITVEDDGTGFTKKDLTNASLAYYRGEKTQADATSHFGLGLYVSSILAEKLGGSLQLSNGAGGGAKIQIKIRCI